MTNPALPSELARARSGREDARGINQKGYADTNATLPICTIAFLLATGTLLEGLTGAFLVACVIALALAIRILVRAICNVSVQFPIRCRACHNWIEEGDKCIAYQSGIVYCSEECERRVA